MEGLEDVKRWWGDKGRARIEIFEGKARFLVDVENGHKTGFYLDQRKSRLALAQFAKGKSVLDLFCYTGAFGISAAVSGASRVHGIDIKKEWLSLARENAAFNGVSEKASFAAGDAFEVLREIYDSDERFDIIVVDPPSFAKDRASVKRASKGYKDINMTAMKALNDNGILATFSCSHNMPNELFFAVVKRAAQDAKKTMTILKRCHQAEDHPIAKAIPETEYLKGYFLRIESL
jgi:23S rRNA (cytosine1962-C5)-methyltransferase